MTTRLNLVSDPWIPVRRRDGVGLVGLDALFADDSVTEVVADSPTQEIAILRLSLAVAHASSPVPDMEAWEGLAGDVEGFRRRTVEYLRQWSDRFWMVHPERPFMQCASLDSGLARPLATLVPSRSFGNNSVWFDHSSGARPVRLTWEEAARWMLACLATDVSGLKTGARGGRESAQQAPLCNVAWCVIEGPDFVTTVLHNMVPDSYLHGIDVPDRSRPWWESDDAMPVDPVERGVAGRLDWLTFPSRRVLVVGGSQPEKVVITPGDSVEDDLDLARSIYEPGIGWRRSKSGPVEKIPIRVDPVRDMWRNSHSLVLKVEGGDWRPVVIDFAERLVRSGHVSGTIPVRVLGVATDKSKYLQWRAESLVLYERLLDREAGEMLREAIDFAEQVGTAVWAAARALDPGRATGVAEGRRNAYWAAVGTAFPGFLARLGSGDVTGAAGEWSAAVRRAAETVMASFFRLGAEEAGRVVKAEAELARFVKEARNRFDAYVQVEAEGGTR